MSTKIWYKMRMFTVYTSAYYWSGNSHQCFNTKSRSKRSTFQKQKILQSKLLAVFGKPLRINWKLTSIHEIIQQEIGCKIATKKSIAFLLVSDNQLEDIMESIGKSQRVCVFKSLSTAKANSPWWGSPFLVHIYFEGCNNSCDFNKVKIPLFFRNKSLFSKGMEGKDLTMHFKMF